MIPDPNENIWEHSRNVKDLYSRRAHGHDEMDAAIQCADLLAPIIAQKGRGSARRPPRLLDAGCGGGYLYHSFKKRNLAVDYFGLDYSPGLVKIGAEILPLYGLPADRLVCGAIEDLSGQKYDLITLLNTLTFCPDFREPLDRLIGCNPRALVIRDNFGSRTDIRWEEDGYLDEGFNHLKAYWNQWKTDDVTAFLESFGYRVTAVEDRRTGGRMEMVVGKPYFWSWLMAVKSS